MDNSFNILKLSQELEDAQVWKEWIPKTPFLKFPLGWEIRIIPPFRGAIIRFNVRENDTLPHEHVSIYLDVSNALGRYFDKDGNEAPYWEVYPIENKDNSIIAERCEISDVKTLISLIKESLSY